MEGGREDMFLQVKKAGGGATWACLCIAFNIFLPAQLITSVLM